MPPLGSGAGGSGVVLLCDSPANDVAAEQNTKAASPTLKSLQEVNIMAKEWLHAACITGLTGFIVIGLSALSGCNRNEAGQPVPAAIDARPRLETNTAVVSGSSTRHPKMSHPKTSHATCMTEIKSLKVGMTQQDVLRVLEQDGGTYTRTRRTYYHPTCRKDHQVLKVEIVFKPATGARDKLHNYPYDVISKISQPFWAMRTTD